MGGDTNECKVPVESIKDNGPEWVLYSLSTATQKITPKLSSLKQHLLSHGFCGSGIQAELRWVLCFTVSARMPSMYQPSGCGLIWRLHWGRSRSLSGCWQHSPPRGYWLGLSFSLIVGWKPPSVSCHVPADFFKGTHWEVNRKHLVARWNQTFRTWWRKWLHIIFAIFSG